MRRKHQRETKVWRDPLLAPVAYKRSDAHPEPRLAEPITNPQKPTPGKRRAARIIAKERAPRDADAIEQDRLVQRLLIAEGRSKITAAYGDILQGGFTPPNTQPFWLQVLEHNDEEVVVTAIEQLKLLVEEDEPHRRKVLDSRLRRIEEFADEKSTQQAAGELRRTLSQL